MLHSFTVSIFGTEVTAHMDTDFKFETRISLSYWELNFCYSPRMDLPLPQIST